jgi:hypothetical protein
MNLLGLDFFHRLRDQSRIIRLEALLAEGAWRRFAKPSRFENRQRCNIEVKIFCWQLLSSAKIFFTSGILPIDKNYELNKRVEKFCLWR